MVDALPTVEQLYRGMGRMVVRFYGRAPGSTSLLAPHAILGCSGLDSIFLNCGAVFGDGPRGDDPAEDRLREFVALIEGRGVGGYVCLSERIQQRLAPLARELGLEPLPPVPLMVRAAAPEAVRGGPSGNGSSPSTGSSAGESSLSAGRSGAELTFERVAGEEALVEFLAVSEAAFDLPAGLYSSVFTPALLDDWALRVYLARSSSGDALSCTCVVDEDGLAGISGMATLPQLQGRGIGGLLLEHVIRDSGPQIWAFYLTASAEGERLYRRHGFATVDSATAWVVPPPDA